MSDTRPSGGLPPIVRDAQRLLLAVEQCVRNFPRYHKYQIGSDLRRQAMEIARSANRAWRDRAQQLAHVQRLVWQTDDMKLSLQLAKTVQAFASFSQFEACARLAQLIAQQAGGWSRKLATSEPRVHSASSAPPPFSQQNGQKHVEPRAFKQSGGQYTYPDSLSPADTPEVKA